ncbi:hypothetical protein KQX54_019989 [Cotesia glomerata]|uniref:Uncharacterized protein n=1 Tax=Cotesia glomerata TaxID=32391 RepID=A0AAV7IHC6_COTGL|nr:hypothetical protein KQX54_019989 [Cotesia glomerata]
MEDAGVHVTFENVTPLVPKPTTAIGNILKGTEDYFFRLLYSGSWIGGEPLTSLVSFTPISPAATISASKG